LSTPTPARATTLREEAAERTEAVTFVSERIMRAEKEGIMASRSAAERFLGWWISKRGERRARPSGETFSGIRILGRLEGGVVLSWGVRAEGAILIVSVEDSGLKLSGRSNGCRCEWVEALGRRYSQLVNEDDEV